MRVSAKVAVLALACAAGYGIASSSGGQAPHQPTATGAKVGAASVAGAPARDAAGGSGALRAATVPRSAAVTLPVTGWMVTAVGDSVMLAAAPALRAALPGIYVDAAPGRQMGAGLAEIHMIAAAGGLRRVVLVGLGTSGNMTARQINQLLAVIGPERWLVLVNSYDARPWERGVNAAIAKAARRDRRVLMVNWFSAIKNHKNLLLTDQIRPHQSGSALYASLVKAVLETIS